MQPHPIDVSSARWSVTESFPVGIRRRIPSLSFLSTRQDRSVADSEAGRYVPRRPVLSRTNLELETTVGIRTNVDESRRTNEARRKSERRIFDSTKDRRYERKDALLLLWNAFVRKLLARWRRRPWKETSDERAWRRQERGRRAKKFLLDATLRTKGKRRILSHRIDGLPHLSSTCDSSKVSFVVEAFFDETGNGMLEARRTSERHALLDTFASRISHRTESTSKQMMRIIHSLSSRSTRVRKDCEDRSRPGSLHGAVSREKKNKSTA